MALNSILFVAVVCAVCITAYIVPRRVRYIWLLLCSLAFYGYATPQTAFQMPQTLQRLGLPDRLPGWVVALGLLLFASLGSWLFVLLMQRAKKGAVRVVFLCLALACSLGLLVACKYLGLLNILRPYADGLVAAESTVPDGALGLPLGLAFYTVQAAGYAADVFAKRCDAERNPLRYTLFLSFFPAVTIGPVNRATALLPQLKEPARFDYDRVAGGAFRILWGFFKKTVIANGLGLFTLQVLYNPTLYTGPVLTVATLLFAVHLYMDVAGCSDIVLGAARMLGFDLAENFARPFAAPTLARFWQRWMMSLVRLVRDNVLAPLCSLRFAAGAKAKPASQKGDAAEDAPANSNPNESNLVDSERATGADTAAPDGAIAAGRGLAFPASVAILLSFLLLGLWHGALLDFVLWGGITGLMLAAARLFDKTRERIAGKVPVYRNRFVRGFFQRVFVFILFCLPLPFFTSGLFKRPFSGWGFRFLWGWDTLGDGSIISYCNQIGFVLPVAIPVALGLVLVAVVEYFAARGGRSVAGWIRTRRFYLRWPLYIGLVLAVILLGSYGVYLNHHSFYQFF